MDDYTKQMDEIEALNAIYGDEWQIEDPENGAYSIIVSEGDNQVKLYIKMPPNYPSKSPPNYEISAPYLDKTTKMTLGQSLEDLYLSFIGQTVIFQWIEKIREELQQLKNQTELSDQILEVENEESTDNLMQQVSEKHIECPEIVHGEIITDRKSAFQGHLAVVTSIDQIKIVLEKLMKNNKIANATHNIHAYRIYQEETNIFISDCENDGESQAGNRLLHLLEIIGVKNILIVVSRWYGGIHLGPDRFKHINNAARQVLLAANLMPNNK